jgi:hypothetical protein
MAAQRRSDRSLRVALIGADPHAVLVFGPPDFSPLASSITWDSRWLFTVFLSRERRHVTGRTTTRARAEREDIRRTLRQRNWARGVRSKIKTPLAVLRLSVRFRVPEQPATGATPPQGPQVLPIPAPEGRAREDQVGAALERSRSLRRRRVERKIVNDSAGPGRGRACNYPQFHGPAAPRAVDAVPGSVGDRGRGRWFGCEAGPAGLAERSAHDDGHAAPRATVRRWWGFGKRREVGRR